MADLNPGTTFAGHRIEGVAGRGGMGTVYRATHLALDHVVALKVISADLAADDAFRERFRSESRIAVSLRHPNVVPIHHAGEEDGLLFVTMDLVDGPDLRRLLVTEGVLDPGRAVGIVEQVAAALDVAHARGLVHRDIKPGNILVERDSGDRAYLTDFGLAKRFDQATDAGALTRTGAFVGTLDYVAPEQIRGGRLDARTDVYALGCVMYEAMAGRAPFADREENVAKIYAHLQDEPPWLPGESGSLDEVLARALAKEPGDRYPSAGDLARAAAAAIEGGEVLRSAERSVATGEAAPETEEPAVPPIADTVEAEPVPPDEPSSPDEPAPTESLVSEPAATEPHEPDFGTTAEHERTRFETTAEHVEPTRIAESDPSAPAPPRAASPAGTTSSGPRWGRIAAALVAVAVVVVAAVLLFGGGDPDNGPGPGAGAGTGAGANDGAGAAAGAATGAGAGTGTASRFAQPEAVGDPIAVPEMPIGITAADGTVAVASRRGQALTFIDEKSGQAGEPVALPGNAQEVAIDDGEAWVTVPTADAVVRVPVGGGEPRPIGVGSPPFGVAADGGSVWVAQPDAGQVTSIDAGDESTSAVAIQGSTDPTELTADGGTIWVVDRSGSQLFRFDAGSTGEQQSFGLGDNPKGVAVGGGSVWVANTDQGDVVQLDLDGGERDEIDVGGEPRLLAYGFDRVWIANGNGELQVINPADGNSVQSLKVGGSPEGVAVGEDSVWVTTGAGGDSVVQVDPDPVDG